MCRLTVWIGLRLRVVDIAFQARWELRVRESLPEIVDAKVVFGAKYKVVSDSE